MPGERALKPVSLINHIALEWKAFRKYAIPLLSGSQGTTMLDLGRIPSMDSRKKSIKADSSSISMKETSNNSMKAISSNSIKAISSNSIKTDSKDEPKADFKRTESRDTLTSDSKQSKHTMKVESKTAETVPSKFNNPPMFKQKKQLPLDCPACSRTGFSAATLDRHLDKECASSLQQDETGSPIIKSASKSRSVSASKPASTLRSVCSSKPVSTSQTMSDRIILSPSSRKRVIYDLVSSDDQDVYHPEKRTAKRPPAKISIPPLVPWGSLGKSMEKYRSVNSLLNN